MVLFTQASRQPESPHQSATLLVSGMKCAGCVQAVERQLKQIPGVEAATVNLVTQKATVEFEHSATTPELLAAKLTASGFASEVELEPELSATEAKTPSQKWQELRPLLMAIALVVLSALGHLSQMSPRSLPIVGEMGFHFTLATLALLGPGRSILGEGWQGLRRNAPNMNTLVGMGSLTSYLASVVALLLPSLGWECFFDAPVMIVGLVLLGRTLEAQARSRANQTFEALLSLQRSTAYILPAEGGGSPKEIPVAEIKPGNRLQVLPGDTFPVDGILVQGTTVVDESMLTGESIPRPKQIGDEVTAGTLNQSDGVTMQATRTGEQTTLAKIIRLVESAQTRKAPIQRLADTVAGYFTYGVMAIASLTFLFWFFWGTHLWPQLLSELPSDGHHMMMAMTSLPETLAPSLAPSSAGLLSLKLAIAVLVVACPCALGLATPTAILVGTSLGAERGLLLRGGDVLEKAHTLDTIVFDKTGTLTAGQPQVTQTWLSTASSHGQISTPSALLQAVANVEQGSRHPYAIAIVKQAQATGLILASDYEITTGTGAGIVGRVNHCQLLVGSLAWMEQHQVTVPEGDRGHAQALMAQGMTVLYCALDQIFVGGIALQDRIRAEAAATLERLSAMGLQTLVLTGDRPENTQVLLQELGLAPEAIRADLSPAGKAEAIATLQAQGHRVAMVGDGINDAPALAQADVGIALSSGTDVAIETAQIVLMRSQIKDGAVDLNDIVAAIRLSRLTFQKIKQNLFWAFSYNTLGIPVAAGLLLPTFHQVLSPAAAAALMACSSVSVISNSLLLRRQFR